MVSKVVKKPLSRRGFLAQTAAVGALLTGRSSEGSPKLSVSRDLFFNLSHVPSDRKLFIMVAGQPYPLRKTAHNPSVLAAAQASNKFLSAVPARLITHYLQGLVIAEDICSLTYTYSEIDRADGTWEMASIVQLIPDSAHRLAHERLRNVLGDAPLPLSAKRRKYGLPPALTIHELFEEQVLIDSTDHARTLITFYPDMMCLEPVSASYIKSNYVEPDIGTTILAQQIESLGTAQPESIGTQGWATLRPLNDDDGRPFKMDDARNEYYPDFHSSIDPLLSQSVVTLHPLVKNDTILGMDITGVTPPTTPLSEFSGKVWYRRDGIAGVSRSPDNTLENAPSVPQMNIVDGSAGLAVSDPGVVVNSDGSATITLNNVQNWFLRFLGLYIQFVDPNGDVISYNKLDRGTIFPDPAPPISGLDLPDDSAFFGGILPPPFTIVGVPIVAGNYSVTVTFPKSASTMRLFYGTLGYNGSAPGPLQVKDVGLAVTALVNYALVVFFAAVGASGIDSAVKLIVGTLGQALALELVTGVKDLLSNSPSSPSFLLALALGILRGILNGLAGKALTTLAGLIAQEVAKAVVRNNIPVAGTAARVAAAVIGAAQLAETMIEAGLSPMVYEFDIVRSHDLTLTISPDPNADEFPKLPIGYTLYYKVNYLFDNASPHYLDAVPLTEPYPRSIQVTLPNLPQGGNINISVGFYAQRNGQAPGINDWCAAKGTTGLQENLSNAPRTITIQQFKIPITKDTVYTHKQITTLDSAGNHQWLITSTAPAFVPLTGEQQPGSLGALRSISVRQRTSQHAGYVGYSWQGYSSGLLDCAAGARGQLDQAANLNTDVANAQNGYASTPCGQQGGAASGMKLTYSLLTDDQENFYLDTNSLLIRQVKLSNPPSFGNPSSGNAFGKLNLESTALLLHPAGHLVSINNTNHKLETLKMSSVPLDDQDAATNYRARVASGQGSRPGLMTSPVASAISPEGVILVLEDSGANNRIQAFDLGGNPIQYFKNQPSPYFLELPATQHARYLDFAIEFSGFVYVLSRGRDGVFRLDIYHPGQSDTRPISTSYNVNGAKLCVDFWRTVYTLNYQVLQLPNGSYPALTEPSVSAWLPSLP